MPRDILFTRRKGSSALG